MPRVLCIWLPNWPIQRLHAENAERLSHPHILLARDPRRGQLVAAMCNAARQRGIQLGMPAGEVDALIGGRPIQPPTALAGPRHVNTPPSAKANPLVAPVIEPHDPWADYDALCQLAIDCSERFSPIVATEHLDAKPWAGRERHQRDSLLLDITGLDRLLGGEGCMGRRITRYFRHRGLRVRIGIAQTVGTAVALARYGPSHRVPIVVPAGQESRYVDPLPVEALRLALPTAETLQQLGIDTIGALRQLPRNGVATRLGDTILQRLDQALGRTEEALQTVEAPANHTLVSDLEYPTRDRDILLNAIAQSLEQLVNELASRNHGVLRFSLRLGGPTAWFSEIILGLYAPCTDMTHLLRLVEHRLQSERLVKPIEKACVRILLSGRIIQRQMECFTSESARHDADGRRLARLIDTLSGRLGRDRVLGVKAIDEPAPELAFETFSLTEHLADLPAGRVTADRPSRSSAITIKRDYAPRRHPLGPTRRDPLRRPLRFFHPAHRLAVSSFDHHGVPKCFSAGNQTHDAARHWGPERIETGWWRGASLCRDYYRLETVDGRWLWIYADRRDTSWWLHGTW